MKLTVFVHDEPVATLESPDGFKHVLTYHPQTRPEQFVSLLMPVRTESWVYPEMHPFFRMNLPEGFLLSILQEQLGPLVGASHINLLAAVGRHAIGRVKVAREGASASADAVAFELKDILRGDNSEEAFVQLVRQYAASGVSGVVPKFLSPNRLGDHNRGTLATDKYIIKGTSSRLPGIALNEHFSMEVARRSGIETADTEVSQDGQALVVHRFDHDKDGATRLGMEDLCSLLALRPEQKYESTWEKVANRIKDVTPADQQRDALARLGELLLLTYALRNADCHTKNIALLYSRREDVTLAPVYYMLTITVYGDYCNNPPGMSVHGRSSWNPGKALEIFLETRCGLKPAQVKEQVEKICEAMVDVSPLVIEASRCYPTFERIGPRMLHAWNDGMNSLRLRKIWSLPSLQPQIDAAGYADTPAPKAPAPQKVGRSPLLGRR